jgi:mono/diheme cytochrome c family protein
LPTDEDLFATHRSWVPPEPEVTAQRIKAGQATFKQVECWKCHGVEGRGNEPSADTLTNDLNRPIKPFNFHDTDRFKCGSTDHDLYKIFMTGLDGTPMPSFMDNLKPDDAWSLVFYLRTLQPMHTKAKDIAAADPTGRQLRRSSSPGGGKVAQ